MRVGTIKEEQVIRMPSVKGTLIDERGIRYPVMPGIVKKKFPWATFAVEIDKGYKCFECASDYTLWQNS